MMKIKRHKKALVAGGAGFIGSHLCDRLVKEGYEVMCLDNLYTGRMENIRHLLENSHFTFVSHDVTKPMSYDDISVIFNLACPASPVHYQKDPVQTYKTSVVGSMNLLDLAKANGARILLASTSEVYGDPHVPVQSETYWGNVNPCGVRSCYDEGKRGAETLFHNYHSMYGVDTRIIRIFNTYGSRMRADDGRVVSNFIVQALKGEPLTIYGDGSQTRSFQYVDDLIDAVMLVMRDGVRHSPINVGNPNEVTVRDLANMMLQITGSHSRISCNPLPQDDPCRRKPDISLAMRELSGWKPKVGLVEGLKKTVEYFAKTL